MDNKTSRRLFLRSTATLGLATAFRADEIFAKTVSQNDFLSPSAGKSLVILFQGDSITDGNRGRNNDPNHVMGHGYAFSVASRVGADFPASQLTFYNRGISGNRVPDLKNRWQTDTLNIKPDVLSVLVGINDASKFISNQTREEPDYDLFETTYRDILTQSKQQNAETLFVLCLPFVYPVGRVKEKWQPYQDTIAKLTARIKKLAHEFNAVTVDFPAAFEKASKKASIDYWTWDGVHPTVAGHELMAREWIRQVGTRLKFLKAYKYK